VNIKLNPKKCVFGIPLDKLLGFLVSHRGIEANPDKIKAIEKMQMQPQRTSPILVTPRYREPLLLYLAATPQMASVVLVAEREEPVPAKEKAASTLAKATQHTSLAKDTSLTKVATLANDKHLAEEKSLPKASQEGTLDEPPDKTQGEAPPAPKTTCPVQRPDYFVTTVLCDAREHYPMQQKLLFTLLITSRHKSHYF
jgi:hypothetical protein